MTPLSGQAFAGNLPALPPGSRIALTTGAEARHLMMAMCKELKRRSDVKIYLYVNSAEGLRTYRPYAAEGVADDVIRADILYQTLLEPVADEADVFREARETEAFIGCTYNMVRMTRRDVGLGFYLGGYNHPLSPFAVLPSYPQLVNAYNKLFAFWKREFESKGITLVLNGLKEEAVMARAMGIPYRYLFLARLESRYYWAANEMCEWPEIKQAYLSVPEGSATLSDDVREYNQSRAQLDRVLGHNLFLNLIKRLFRHAKREIYMRLKYPFTTPGYYYWSTVAFLWREYRDLKRLRPPNTRRLSDMRGKRFVFFPLHTEPEMSLHWMSPEYFSQLEAIALIARDLPAGVYLAVKETFYGAGRRPPKFYDQIRRLKNTVLLDVWEFGVDVVRESDAVITIGGTAGLEAAFMGKPVILFGQHNFYDFLPHVRVVRKTGDLADALKFALAGGFDTEKARRDAARLRQAMKNASFDLGSYSNIDDRNFDKNGVRLTADALISSVAREALKFRAAGE